MDGVFKCFGDVDGRDEHGEDVLREGVEELDDERALEASDRERDQENPEADPSSPD